MDPAFELTRSVRQNGQVGVLDAKSNNKKVKTLSNYLSKQGNNTTGVGQPSLINKIHTILPWSHSKTISSQGPDVSSEKVFISQISIMWKSSVVSSFPGKIEVSMKSCPTSFDNKTMFSIVMRAGVNFKISITTRLPLPENLTRNPYVLDYTPDAISNVELGELNVIFHTSRSVANWSDSSTPMTISTLLKEESSSNLLYLLTPNDHTFCTNIKSVLDRAITFRDLVPNIVLYFMIDMSDLVKILCLADSVTKSEVSSVNIINKKLEGSSGLTEDETYLLSCIKKRATMSHLPAFLNSSIDSLGLREIYEQYSSVTLS